MRHKTNTTLPGFFTINTPNTKTNKLVQHYRDTYKQIDHYLNTHPELLDAAHQDLRKLCVPNPQRPHTPDFTTENLFRTLLVMHSEGLNYRETSLRIAESPTLQYFCRLDKKETINHSLLCAANKVITPTTWKTINHSLANSMKQEKKITTNIIRTDTTVVETNIHYPTDSSLLWDTYRTIDRLWTKALDQGFGTLFPDFRFHPEKVRKLHLTITRFASSKNKKRQRMVKNNYKTLITRTAYALEKAQQIANTLLASGNDIAIAIGVELSSYFAAMEKVIDAARRRQAGESVPVEDKVFSIFESHTELIQRGKRDKPIEFGHKIVLSETREHFITDYDVFLKSPSDTKLLPPVVDQHYKLFHEYPSRVVADMGFHPGNGEFARLNAKYKHKVQYFGVPGRLREFGDVLMSLCQRWRAGIEGTISCLKRAFRLSRCYFRGFSSFCSGVGGAIFCHNLLVMVRRDLAMG